MDNKNCQGCGYPKETMGQLEWETRIPTPGGWWKIDCDENCQFNLSFVAVLSPGALERPIYVANRLSMVFAYLAKAQAENE